MFGLTEDEARLLLQSIQAVASFAAVMVAVGAILFTIHANKCLKKIDSTLSLQRRYDDVVDLLSSLAAKEPLRPDQDLSPEWERAFDRYWQLQLEQFTMWRRGLVEESSFAFWMQTRLSDWTFDTRCGVPYRRGWNFARARLADKRFEDFIESVHSGAPERAIASVSKAERNAWQRMLSWRTGCVVFATAFIALLLLYISK